VANSRAVLYELINQPLPIVIDDLKAVETVRESSESKTIIAELPTEVVKQSIDDTPVIEAKQDVGSVSITNSDIKIVYVNTVVNEAIEIKKETVEKVDSAEELTLIKSIENETEVPLQQFDEEKLNKTIEQEISKSIIQSYVETDIIKTPDLHKEEKTEPSSFADWLKTIQKEGSNIQIETKTNREDPVKNEIPLPEKEESVKKPSFFSQNKQIIDKIIESDPGRIKLGNNKFFVPASEAKQSLLENEHLVTETLAKIYALQGNISKAIRAYEILSLKFPQKSVYFATLIEKLKTNK
jgi:hypothetical protein